jgi:2-amino-4-hydroxy-6-hydroxymethyldihydropteridine diphosphokinase
MRVELPAVLSLGSNLGDREESIRSAIAEIDALDGVTVTSASGLYESAAVKESGVDDTAPAYLNAVIAVRSALHPQPLLDALSGIETRHGRIRTERWGDRTLDIDIVSFGGLRVDSDRLRIPHPRAAERAFVLAPWLEIQPDATLPGHGRIDALLARLPVSVRPFASEPLL